MSEIIQKSWVLSDFLPSSKKKRLVLLTGARQTGKTTLALWKYPDLRYISLDAPEIGRSKGDAGGGERAWQRMARGTCGLFG